MKVHENDLIASVLNEVWFFSLIAAAKKKRDSDHLLGEERTYDNYDKEHKTDFTTEVRIFPYHPMLTE